MKVFGACLNPFDQVKHQASKHGPCFLKWQERSKFSFKCIPIPLSLVCYWFKHTIYMKCPSKAQVSRMFIQALQSEIQFTGMWFFGSDSTCPPSFNQDQAMELSKDYMSEYLVAPNQLPNMIQSCLSIRGKLKLGHKHGQTLHFSTIPNPTQVFFWSHSKGIESTTWKGVFSTKPGPNAWRMKQECKLQVRHVHTSLDKITKDKWILEGTWDHKCMCILFTEWEGMKIRCNDLATLVIHAFEN